VDSYCGPIGGLAVWGGGGPRAETAGIDINKLIQYAYIYVEINVQRKCELVLTLHHFKPGTITVTELETYKLSEQLDKTKYMVMSQDQHAGRSHNMKIDNNSLERVEEFKYLGTTLTNQNSIQ
jgi:hypothetical protein